MRPTIIIEIKGGCLTGVHATEEIDYVLLDHDNIEQGDEPTTEMDSQDSKFEHWKLESKIEELIKKQ
jgi:hypothetical protein